MTTPLPTTTPTQQQPQTLTLAQQKQTHLDLAITLALHTWPALSLAVTSNWGGPTSSDKRDWLCGAISDMLSERPGTDAEDLEDVLVQVMNDEFDVVVDDESAAGVAGMIVGLREKVARGDFGEVRELWRDWEGKKAGKGMGNFRGVGDVEPELDGDEGEEDSEDDDEDGDGDAEMGDAPGLVSVASRPRERVEPEVDEDGFTKVAGRKKR